ncbi:uncharacterized protein CXorf38-like, partial [Ruditapes philippinarum]|uniref:uncharacterized protein CXorf38-like n=1 Tax=Ruditapes philippinarum TaxID=129788 RepID=UPI00295C1A4C
MSHQSEIEKTKYRNWVKGGLALKYFREGIKGFADKIVKQEHQRILSVAGHTTGLPCNQCCIKTLRPIHRCIKDQSSGRPFCPLVQTHCSCMDLKAKPCPNKICDIVLEEVLNNHASTPPQPNWRNTDIQKWVVSPWEIAKCFIQAPGYSSKTGIADVDLSGLLHIFIYNFSFHEHFSCSVTSTDRLKKALQIRNDIFHSPNMEIDDTEFNTCIDNILDILGDDKELKSLDDVKQAVSNLKELKNKGFIITTHSESEVCRASIASIIQHTDELTDNIEKITESVRANVLEYSRNDCEVLKQRVERLETNVASMQQRLSNLERKKEEMDAIR